MVTDSAALESIANGPDGIVSGLGPGKVLIDMSTVSPAASKALAEKVRAKGADMVDSPVSGSVITLEQGKLTMMVGGRAETFEKIKPLLLDIGPKATHVGDNGLAVSMKIATNLSLVVQMLAFSEAVLLAEKSGIPRKTAVEVLTNSVIASPMVQYRGPMVINPPDEAWFDMRMMQKDTTLALEMGRRLGVPLPTTSIANEYLTAARAMGLTRERLRGHLPGARADVRSPGMTMATNQLDNALAGLEIGKEKLLRLYRQMVAIRLFEERVNDLYTRAVMPGLAHLYIGEEAIAVGVCEALRRDDYITSTHRGHGHCLAKGAIPS
jgi:3-hydroxyisobutyrate dehydrogenase-like beta-hydroxyacid dehydrogenase